MLILFDIDGTMLRSERVGIRAMEAGGRSVWGDSFSMDGVDVAGRLDCLIWKDAAAANSIEDIESEHARFRAAYGAALEQMLANEEPVRILPGIPEMVDALHAMDDVTIGLLTGNYPETGRMKVASGGVDPSCFVVNAFGESGASRRDLPVRAMAEFEAHHGRPVAPGSVVIMGDTPHDVDCAKHHGCRSLAVATGGFGLDALVETGPDLAVEDFSDVAAIIGWMLNR